jgi:hypothetical protein
MGMLQGRQPTDKLLSTRRLASTLRLVLPGATPTRSVLAQSTSFCRSSEMALYDHRVFKQDPNWWVAQVHGQNSAVRSGPAAKAPMTHDFVFFTSLTLENTDSRVAFIPTGHQWTSYVWMIPPFAGTSSFGIPTRTTSSLRRGVRQAMQS